MGPHRVVVVGYDDAELVDIACVTSALALANRLGADPAYQVVLANVTGDPIRCETGWCCTRRHDSTRSGAPTP
jgi:transcriptional regulator GlxA family with amidase domain